MTTDDGPNPNRVLLDEIHRLRGEFLSEMADVEQMLNSLIVLYFRIPANEREKFIAWVLTPLKFPEKVEVVARVTRTDRPGNTLKPILSRVKALYRYRNEIAHAGVDLHIGPDQTVDEALADWKWAATRWTRSGAKSEVLDIDRMKRAVAFRSLFVGTPLDRNG